jgi:hypothetical protein
MNKIMIVNPEANIKSSVSVVDENGLANCLATI